MSGTVQREQSEYDGPRVTTDDEKQPIAPQHDMTPPTTTTRTTNILKSQHTTAIDVRPRYRPITAIAGNTHNTVNTASNEDLHDAGGV